jgi:NADPH2:quinone reductase
MIDVVKIARSRSGEETRTEGVHDQFVTKDLNTLLTALSFDSSMEGFASGQWFRPHLPSLRKVVAWSLARALRATGDRSARTYYVRPGAKFRADLAALFELVTTGVLTPTVDTRYPLDQAAGAVRHLIDGRVVGKLVLVP